MASAAGYTYISGQGVMWRLNGSNDWLNPVAGVGFGLNGKTGDGIPAMAASAYACGLAVDQYGNLLFADGARIRVVARSTSTFYGQSMTAGHIYTIAGGGTSTADGVPALQAALNGPQYVTTDASGNIVISDVGNSQIRVVALTSGTYYGKAMVAGDIYTVFDGGTTTTLGQLIVDQAGNLVGIDATDSSGGAIVVVAESTGSFYGKQMTVGGVYPVVPVAAHAMETIGRDAAGNVLLTSWPGQDVQVLAASSGTFYGQNMTVGKVYTVAGGGTSTAEGVPALQASITPDGIAVDQAGNLVINDRANARIRVVALASGNYYGKAMTAGDIYTVAGTGSFAQYSGNGGPATQAQMYQPDGLGFDRSGNVLIADGGNNAVRVLAETTGTYYGTAMTKGHIYTIANVSTPSAVQEDAVGNIVVLAGNSVDVIAAVSGLDYGIEMVAGSTYTVTSISSAGSLAIDSSGNLVIGGGTNITVFAVKTGSFYGQAMAAYHSYNVAGNGSPNCNRNLSGVPAVQAGICSVNGVALDASGNVVFTDAQNAIVRVIAVRQGTFYGMAMKAEYVYTVAGTGLPGLSGNGGPALQAAFNLPGSVAVDASGNLLIADLNNNQVRLVAAHTGTYYGQAMKAGFVYRIAGTGVCAFAGDGGPATSAWLCRPLAVIPRPGGGTLVADQNNRVRLIAF